MKFNDIIYIFYNFTKIYIIKQYNLFFYNFFKLYIFNIITLKSLYKALKTYKIYLYKKTIVFFIYITIK